MKSDKAFILKFGKNIQELRKQRSLTQDDLSAITDIPRTQLGRIERGEINTTIKTILRLAKALELKPKDLLDF